MSERKMRSKAEQSEATIQHLLAIAEGFFAKQGYVQSAAEDIVQAAGLTRGALYHHFNGKEGLFKAVLERVQQRVAQQVGAAAAQSASAWDQLITGCRAFLVASTDPQISRIMLIDGPAVLGWQIWRQIDAENSMKSLREGLTELLSNQQMDSGQLDALTHLLSGAMNEAALWIADSSQPAQALENAMKMLERLLATLRN